MFKKIVSIAAIGMLVGCSKPIYLEGERLVGNNASFGNDVERNVIVKYINEDNGTIYCIPNMTDEQLVEFRARVPAMLIENAFTMSASEDVKQLLENPVRNGFRMAFKRHYPCNSN